MFANPSTSHKGGMGEFMKKLRIEWNAQIAIEKSWLQTPTLIDSLVGDSIYKKKCFAKNYDN